MSIQNTISFQLNILIRIIVLTGAILFSVPAFKFVPCFLQVARIARHNSFRIGNRHILLVRNTAAGGAVTVVGQCIRLLSQHHGNGRTAGNIIKCPVGAFPVNL